MISSVENKTTRSVEFRSLVPADTARLAGLLAAQRTQYMAHFAPFAFDAQTIARTIASAKRDQYWALSVDGKLAGFCMLRGLDQGFERPAFGVFVAERYSGRGLAGRALEHCLQWCMQQNIAEVMLKVAEDNAAAKTVYERAGFRPQGPCPDTGHIIYAKSLVTN
jgi:RimJ/RimL family protein N-acetyltransferase